MAERQCIACGSAEKYLRAGAKCKACREFSATCPGCGQSFSGRKRKYCTERCGKRDGHRRKRRRLGRPQKFGVRQDSYRLGQRYNEAFARGYTGSIEEYAEYIERYRMRCAGAGAWKKWRPRAPAKPRAPGRYSHMTDAEYYRLRYHGNVDFRLKERMRRQFMKWLGGRRQSAPSFVKALRYSVAELRAHIEDQFTDGMSWENFGSWHVDHIRPKGTFDPHDERQMQECWALSNLRPLWARDNLKRPRDGRDVLAA